MNVASKLWKNAVTFAQSHVVEIMGFATGVGVCTTAILSVKGDRKAQKIWNEAEKEKDDILEYLRHTWKYYIPGAFSGAATLGLIWGSHKLTAGKIAALSSLYSISENSLKEYKGKVEEILGDKKAESIQSKICEDIVKNNPPPPDEMVLGTRYNGAIKCLEPLTGRYFWSDSTRILNAKNEANSEMLKEMFLSLNAWFEFLGLDYIDPVIGDDIGWNSDNLIELTFDWQKWNPNDPDPILTIVYRNGPSSSYRHYL